MLRATVLLVLATSPLDGADLKIVAADGTHKVDVRYRDGRRYLELKDLARAFDCRWKELPDRSLALTTPKASLRMVADQALLELPETGSLLKSPVWRRSPNSWWVPEDFLTRVLGPLLSLRLSPLPEGYRVEAMEAVRVHVDVFNYPDHVSVHFQSSDVISDGVRDSGRHLELPFEGVVVEASFGRQQPLAAGVRELRFTAGDGYPGFRLLKGDNFESYRVSRSSSRSLVLDVYFDQPAVTAVDSAALDRVPVPADTVETLPAPPVSRPGRTVVIDPGHGGPEHGWVWAAGVEKTLVLELASEVAAGLEALGIDARLTRRRDVNPTAEIRSATGNQFGGAAFIGLHARPLPGTQVYVYGDPFITEELRRPRLGLAGWDDAYRRSRLASWRLARRLQLAMNSIDRMPRPPLEARLQVLRAVQAPAVLVEVGPDETGAFSADVAPRLIEAIASVVGGTGP